MKRFGASMRFAPVFCSMLMLAVLSVPRAVQAQYTWQANMGAQSHDMGTQANAFLPNELWINAGDSIKWTSHADAIHTVSFLKQVAGLPFNIFTTGASTGGTSRPSFIGPFGPFLPPAGCAGDAQGGTAVTPSGSSFNGSACVNSGPFAEDATTPFYTVTFPAPGNFKLVCLVHRDMTGVVHVLASGAPLPHEQAFYDNQAADEARDLITDNDHEGEWGDHDRGESPMNAVTAGIGEVVATGGGKQYRAVLRFLRARIRVHVGDTVEWTNLDPAEPHTVTFGDEPGGPADPSHCPSSSSPFPPPPFGPPCSVDADAAVHATISTVPGTPGARVHSGFIAAALQDQDLQTALGVQRFRVTFNQAGTFHYICAIHDQLGMVGDVIVKP